MSTAENSALFRNGLYSFRTERRKPINRYKEVEQTEMLISSLIGLGMGYNEIKAFINEKYRPILMAG